VALKKSDLYSSLWQSCDELRGGMDASQYKDYILTLLFVKYVTDKAKSDGSSLIVVPEGGSFDDMVALKGDPEIGEKMNKVIGKLAEANDLQTVIDQADFNDPEKLGSGKEMQDRLSNLVSIFNDLDFRGSHAEGDDLLGDAYEYLMRHFATESGKSKGQFYTPAEVSRVMAKIIGIDEKTRQDQTVYDPTCGSGSLLLKVAAEAPRGISIYGQEKDNATYALSRMNMILHDNADAVIQKGDTITSPKFVSGDHLRTFDFAVANPPFSNKSWSNGLENDYGRFEYGTPPRKNGDYAFLLHVLKSLKSTGTAAIILPHGVLFRGNAEGGIRRELLKRGYIKGIVGLPPNLFYGTGIPACIVVLDKAGAGGPKDVFMIDASRGFVKDGPKNRLRSQDIHKIVDVFVKQTEVERYSRLVPFAEIASEANDYNLNLARFIDSSEPEDIQDLHAHLHGGIPDRDIDALAPFWDAFPSLRAQLFKGNRTGYSDLKVDVTEVRQTVLDSPEFQRFAGDVAARLAEWFAVHRPTLASITADTKPNNLIAKLGDDLLARVQSVPLLDPYDVYERLLSYWHETMHDDVFLIMSEAWFGASKPRATIVDKDRKLNEVPDLVTGSGRQAKKYKMNLVPPDLIVAAYFANEKAAVDDLSATAERTMRLVDEYVEEHAVEEGLLWAAIDDDKVTKKSAAARLMEAMKQDADLDEIAGLEHVIALFTDETAAKRAYKDAQAALDLQTLKQYANLSETEVQTLVLDGKWQTTVTRNVSAEVESLTLALVARVQQLGKRYAETVADLHAELRSLEAKVEDHLTAMGVDS
jgi:type I restriction enzyme M protein